MAEYTPGTGPGYLGGGFEIDIRNFITRTNRRIDQVVRKVIIDIFDNIVSGEPGTPVDTGYARSCWGVGQTVPQLNLARPDPDARYDYEASKAAGEAAIRATRVGEGLVCYLYNNCRYIIPLEYGHSGQAPRGMARVTLVRFENYVAAAAATTP